MNEILSGKIQSIQRCVARAREEYALAEGNFRSDFTHQDSAVLNVTRACETAIDLANYIIKLEKLGIPMSSRESFDLLMRSGLISSELDARLENMVGFRNLAIHAYQKLNLDVVEAIILSGLDDLLAFAQIVQDKKNKIS